MAEAYYNPQTSKLVIGQAALAAESAAWEMGDYDYLNPPSDAITGNFYSLPDLLTRDTLPADLPPKPSEQPQPTRWNAESIASMGRWVLGQLKLKGVHTIDEKHLGKLHQLNIGPHTDLIRRRISGGISQLRRNLGVTGGRNPRTTTPQWSNSQWQQYAKRVEQSLKDGPRRPTSRDYAAASRRFRGPSIHAIKVAIGFNRLNALIGYLDASQMDQTDLLDWGVRACLANPANNNQLSRFTIEALSNRGVGPSLPFITRHFGSLSEYQRQVRQQLQAETAKKQAHRRQLLDDYAQQASLHQPAKLDEQRDGPPPEEPSADQKVQIAARYVVAAAILGHQRTDTAWTIANSSTSLPTLLRQATRRITARQPTDGEIELQAELLGVADDIWPPDQDLDRLQVASNEIDGIRQRSAAYRQQTKHS